MRAGHLGVGEADPLRLLGVIRQLAHPRLQVIRHVLQLSRGRRHAHRRFTHVRVSSGVAGRARLSRRLARGAAGWPGRAATASRPAGHPASHAEKRAGRLEKTGWPTGRPAGQNRLADRLAGRPADRPDHSVECAGCSKSGSGGLFLPILLRTAGKMHFSYRPVARRSPHHLASAPGR